MPMPLLSPDMKIFLVGFMGTGKTTLGRMLAERLGWEFQDLDAVLEKDEGAPITRIFAEKGEPFFRELETRSLARIVAAPGRAVVACGGGAFCAPENQALMRGGGITVWLDQPFEQIWERRKDLARGRPLMRGESELRALYEQRRDSYRAATLHLPVTEGGLPQALDELLRFLAERFGVNAP